MKLRKKSVAAVLAVTMALFCIIGGTLAWLTAETGQVENVFTVGNINLTLDEADTDDSTADKDRDLANAYKMVPGNVLAKDPTVIVEVNSEACWLFVKVEESIKSELTFSNYLSYKIADGWKQLSGHDGVYYRQVPAITEDTKLEDRTFYVLAGDTSHPHGIVTVSENVTKAMMEALGDNTANYPTLTFTAYAVQKDNIATAAEAWAKLPGNVTGTDTETD